MFLKTNSPNRLILAPEGQDPSSREQSSRIESLTNCDDPEGVKLDESWTPSGSPRAIPTRTGGVAAGYWSTTPTNPFATRWTKPGAIRFDFGGRGTIEDILHRLADNDYRGTIVGPHGSGKSTLLATLGPGLEAAGRTVFYSCLHDGQRRLSMCRRETIRLGRASIVVIDGYEQLGRLRRWRLEMHSRRRGYGLLVTSHRECGLPVHFRTEPNLAMFERLIKHSLPSHGGLIRGVDIERAWQRHAGNVREVLFELYDVFEARRRL